MQPGVITRDRILEILVARAKRTDDGWQTSWISHRAIAARLEMNPVTVCRQLRAMAACGLVRPMPVMVGGRRASTRYFIADEVASGVPGTTDHRAALNGVLGTLRAQLAALDTAREQTLASVASVERLLKGRTKGRTDGESSSSAGT